MLGLDRTSFSRPWGSAPPQRRHPVPTLTRSLEGPPALPLRHTQLLCLAPRAPGQPCVSPARSAVPCLHPTRPAISPQTHPGNAAESEAPSGVAFLVPEPPSLAGPWGTRVPSGLLPPFPRLLFLLSEPFAPVLGLLILFSDLELHPRALLSSLPPSLCLVSSPDTLCPTWGISRGRESLLGRPPILAKCTPCAGPGGRGPAHTPTLPCWPHQAASLRGCGAGPHRPEGRSQRALWQRGSSCPWPARCLPHPVPEAGRGLPISGTAWPWLSFPNFLFAPVEK